MYVLYDIDKECYMPVDPDTAPEAMWEEVQPGINTDYSYCIKNGKVEWYED